MWTGGGRSESLLELEARNEKLDDLLDVIQRGLGSDEDWRYQLDGEPSAVIDRTLRVTGIRYPLREVCVRGVRVYNLIIAVSGETVSVELFDHASTYQHAIFLIRNDSKSVMPEAPWQPRHSIRLRNLVGQFDDEFKLDTECYA